MGWDVVVCWLLYVSEARNSVSQERIAYMNVCALTLKLNLQIKLANSLSLSLSLSLLQYVDTVLASHSTDLSPTEYQFVIKSLV